MKVAEPWHPRVLRPVQMCSAVELSATPRNTRFSEFADDLPVRHDAQPLDGGQSMFSLEEPHSPVAKDEERPSLVVTSGLTPAGRLRMRVGRGEPPPGRIDSEVRFDAGLQPGLVGPGDPIAVVDIPLRFTHEQLVRTAIGDVGDLRSAVVGKRSALGSGKARVPITLAVPPAIRQARRRTAINDEVVVRLVTNDGTGRLSSRDFEARTHSSSADSGISEPRADTSPACHCRRPRLRRHPECGRRWGSCGLIPRSPLRTGCTAAPGQHRGAA